VVFFFIRRRGAAALEYMLGHGLGAGEIDLQRRQGHVDLVVCGRLWVKVPLDAVVREGDQACSDDDAEG
jgi:hypothetical protein